MNLKRNLMLISFSIMLIFSLIPYTNALSIDESEIGVDIGDKLSWGIYETAWKDNYIHSYQVLIKNVLSVEGDLICNAQIIYPNNMEIYLVVDILIWNSNTGYLDMSEQSFFEWPGGLYIVPKPLNLSLLGSYLINHGYTDVMISRGLVNTIIGIYGDIYYSMTFNDNGILIEGSVFHTIIADYSFELKLEDYDDGSISFGSIFFFIIPIVIIALIIKKRKSINIS